MLAGRRWGLVQVAANCLLRLPLPLVDNPTQLLQQHRLVHHDLLKVLPADLQRGQENTTLVRTGPFKWVRHPIYTAMMAFGLGLLLVTPNLVALAGFILLVATLEVHVRRVEEPYLLRTHSAVYRGYTASVGRFVPGVGLIR